MGAYMDNWLRNYHERAQRNGSKDYTDEEILAEVNADFKRTAGSMEMMEQEWLVKYTREYLGTFRTYWRFERTRTEHDAKVFAAKVRKAYPKGRVEFIHEDTLFIGWKLADAVWSLKRRDGIIRDDLPQYTSIQSTGCHRDDITGKICLD